MLSPTDRIAGAARRCSSKPPPRLSAGDCIGNSPHLNSARTTNQRKCSATVRGTYNDRHLLALGSPLGLYAELSNP